MRGQLIEKGKGIWLIRIQKRGANGKRKSHSETLVGSKSDAQKRLTSMLAELDSAVPSSVAVKTLNEFLDLWLETIARPRLQLRTFDDYKNIIRLHVRETIGKLDIAKLQAFHIQSLYGRLQNDRKLSARRIRYVHAVLSSALKKAVELDLITRNVAKLVQLPRQSRKEMDVLNEEECRLFLDASRSERLGTMFSVALATGMRPEEYLALQWKDLDLERHTAAIRRTVIRVTGSSWFFSEPKTKASARKIALPKGLVEEVRRHRRRTAEERLRLGPLWNDFDLVFPSELGTPITHSNVTQVFKRILRRAGIRSSLRLYDLRHTHATLLLKADVHPKIVSERLGHSTIGLTLDVYSHVLPTMQAAAAEHLDGMLYRWSA